MLYVADPFCVKAVNTQRKNDINKKKNLFFMVWRKVLGKFYTLAA
jgi:hypothetical protein